MEKDKRRTGELIQEIKNDLKLLLVEITHDEITHETQDDNKSGI